MKRRNKLKVGLLLIVLGIIFIISSINKLSFILDIGNSYENIETNLRTSSFDWDPQIRRMVGDEPTCVFVGDANNDGYNDIVTSNWASNDISIILWNAISGDWDPQVRIGVGEYPISVFVGDANNDGYNDIVTSNHLEDISILLWNAISGDWDPEIRRYVYSELRSVFVGDVNNDGYNDIVTSQYSMGWSGISILLWNAISGDWDPPIHIMVGDSPWNAFVGDANNDGYNDIIISNYGGNDISILLWNAISGDWDSERRIVIGNVPTCVFVGDVNNDGYNDIVTSNTASNDISILLWNVISGDWDPQIRRYVGDEPRCVFVGDANNDGYNDIITSNYASNDISILLWNAISMDWDPQIRRSVGDGPGSVFVGDANNDGYNDIVTSNHDSNDISILLWNVMEEFKYIFQGVGVLYVEGKCYRGESKLYISDDLIRVEVGDKSASWIIKANYTFRNVEYYYGTGPQGRINVVIYQRKNSLFAIGFGKGVLFHGQTLK